MTIKINIKKNILPLIVVLVLIILVTLINPKVSLGKLILGWSMFALPILLVTILSMSSKIVLSDDGFISFYIFGFRTKYINSKNIDSLNKKYIFKIFKGLGLGKALLISYVDNKKSNELSLGIKAYGKENINKIIDFTKKHNPKIVD